jgi:hypothetical protein
MLENPIKEEKGEEDEEDDEEDEDDDEDDEEKEDGEAYWLLLFLADISFLTEGNTTSEELSLPLANFAFFSATHFSISLRISGYLRFFPFTLP